MVIYQYRQRRPTKQAPEHCVRRHRRLTRPPKAEQKMLAFLPRREVRGNQWKELRAWPLTLLHERFRSEGEFYLPRLLFREETSTL